MDQNDQNRLFDKVDQETKRWQQGDYCLGDLEFSLVVNNDQHIATSERLDSEETNILQPVHGLCVVSQTCDIVRTCRKRPYIELSPLVEVMSDFLAEVKKGMRPNYAFLKPLENDHLVVDLDRTMTAEKSILLKLDRLAGLDTEQVKRMFSWSLGRKRTRYAFPDEFTALIDDFSSRIKKKYKKSSDEGKFINSLREIRVRAAPSWSHSSVEVTLYLVKESQPEVSVSDQKAREIIKTWESLIGSSILYHPIKFELTDLETLSAREYVESDPLDFDHLSQSS